MGVGASLVLVAAGAILWWAVDVETDGLNLNTVGIVLFVVGAVGLALSLVFWSSWGGFGGYRDRGVGVPLEDGVYRERVHERERIL